MSRSDQDFREARENRRDPATGRVAQHTTDTDEEDATDAITRAKNMYLAQAWDEGYRGGFSVAMRRMSDEPNAPEPPNPYRREES